MKAKIYITIDNSSPKLTEKNYGYVLECMINRSAITREGFGKTTGTYHQATLTAMAEALGRFEKSCEICICTEDEFVLNMIDHNIATWAENDFLTSKKKPVANQKEWMEVWKLIKRHKVLGKPGKHEYAEWIRREIKNREEKRHV